MRKTFILVLSLLNIQLILSQCIVIDSLTKDTIPFVEIYSVEQKSNIGGTDVDGKITISNNLSGKNVYLVHPSYQIKEVKSEDLKKTGFIFLNPHYDKLKEVSIEVKSNQNYKYLKIRSYYRTINYSNGNLHFVSDGIVDYYISVNTKKIKKVKKINSRMFENFSFSMMGKAKNINFKKPEVPYISELILYENLSKKYDIQKKTENKLLIYDKNYKQPKGEILINNSINNLQLNRVSEDYPEVHSLFGFQFSTLNANIFAIYNTQNTRNINFKNILYFKSSGKSQFKHKKDLEHNTFLYNEEVFVLDTKYVNEIEKIEDIKIDNYWQNIQNPYYQPLPASIEKYIKENLTEVK